MKLVYNRYGGGVTNFLTYETGNYGYGNTTHIHGQLTCDKNVTVTGNLTVNGTITDYMKSADIEANYATKTYVDDAVSAIQTGTCPYDHEMRIAKLETQYNSLESTLESIIDTISNNHTDLMTIINLQRDRIDQLERRIAALGG